MKTNNRRTDIGAESTESNLRNRYRGLKPFKPGQSGNPAGRPKGSRNRLGEQFVADLYEEWRRSGANALKRVAEDDPVQFVRVVAGILPKELDATLSIDVELFAECRDFAAAFRLARDHIGAEVVDSTGELMIEAQADE